MARLDELSDEMVPFEGSAEEADALAQYLYFLSEREEAPAPGPAPTAAVGAELFETECAACHSAEDMAGILAGWEAAEIREALGKLDELSDEMAPFAGSPEEMEALTGFLHSLGREN